MARLVSVFDVSGLPYWRRPIFLLFMMSVAMPIAFNVWSALLNNFVIQMADFDGSDIGLLHTVREIPGFLAVGVILLLLILREQTLALISLLTLGIATAVAIPSVKREIKASVCSRNINKSKITPTAKKPGISLTVCNKPMSEPSKSAI